MDIILQLIKYVIVRKKYWLIPILIIFLLLGSLLFLSQGSVVAPLIYTVF